MTATFQTEGFLVVEACEDFEQVLSLVVKPDYPPDGILEFSDERDVKTVFRSRKEAREAISRTTHYARAFGRYDGFNSLPLAKHCRIVPVRSVTFKKEEA
jgi:hypothetical protein